jgi:hypothetical protein
MNDDRASFAARVICLYLDDPDTPDMPNTADWDIAHGLFERGISFEMIRLAFWLAFIRRRKAADTPMIPIRSLAYFRAVAFNLTPEEREPAYVEYVRRLYEQFRASESVPTPQTCGQNRVEKPESRGLS